MFSTAPLWQRRLLLLNPLSVIMTLSAGACNYIGGLAPPSTLPVWAKGPSFVYERGQGQDCKKGIEKMG